MKTANNPGNRAQAGQGGHHSPLEKGLSPRTLPERAGKLSRSAETLGDASRGGSNLDSVCEILVLPDGRVFAHNISPLLAEILTELNPADAAMKQRASRARKNSTAW